MQLLSNQYVNTSLTTCVHILDMVLLAADMPTLLGVASGIFVLAGLLCMVLHLYTRARFHPTHLADAHLTPPCLYSLNDTGKLVYLGNIEKRPLH